MTTEEKNKVLTLSRKGMEGKEIAKSLSIPYENIKKYLQRHKDDPVTCSFCGNEMSQQVGKRFKRFCCDKCRMNYWNRHKKVESRKSTIKRICEHCGQPFFDFQNRGRRFCSRACHLKHRYSNGQTSNKG